MLPTSGTYNFQSIQIELIIREAYERIGISGEFVEVVKLDSAKRSLDLLFLEWMNKSINLWTLEKAYLPLVASQRGYILPANVSNIIQANLRTSTRQLNGTAASSAGGVALNAFDGNPSTACTQTAPNGNISYDYGVGITQKISFIGIQSNEDNNYSIIVEFSLDNINWKTLVTLTSKLDFKIGINQWFEIPTPIEARAYRIRETQGATLNIQEIYFNNNILDFPISAVTRYEYYTYPNKNLVSRPSIFYLDRQIMPILNIWPTPSIQYNCLQYLYKKMIEDTGSLYNNTVQIPSRFYPALIWGLSWQLAMKFNPQQAAMLKGEYEQSFSIAATEDSETRPITIAGDKNYYNE
jgi:hypothetical protein